MLPQCTTWLRTRRARADGRSNSWRPTSSCLASGKVGIGRSLRCPPTFDAFVPRDQGGRRAHDQDSDDAVDDLHRNAAADLDRDEMRGEGEEHAETKDFERML